MIEAVVLTLDQQAHYVGLIAEYCDDLTKSECTNDREVWKAQNSRWEFAPGEDYHVRIEPDMDECPYPYESRPYVEQYQEMDAWNWTVFVERHLALKGTVTLDHTAADRLGFIEAYHKQKREREEYEKAAQERLDQHYKGLSDD